MKDPLLSITKTIKGRLPGLPFAHMKQVILGKNYELGVVFIGATRARTLNKEFRHKDYTPDILSFPYSKKEGEIFINLKQAKKNAATFRMPEKDFLYLLFIHGLLHLKGFTHGSTMDKMERTYLKRFLH